MNFPSLTLSQCARLFPCQNDSKHKNFQLFLLLLIENINKTAINDVKNKITKRFLLNSFFGNLVKEVRQQGCSFIKDEDGNLKIFEKHLQRCGDDSCRTFKAICEKVISEREKQASNNQTSRPAMRPEHIITKARRNAVPHFISPLGKRNSDTLSRPNIKTGPLRKIPAISNGNKPPIRGKELRRRPTNFHQAAPTTPGSNIPLYAQNQLKQLEAMRKQTPTRQTTQQAPMYYLLQNTNTALTSNSLPPKPALKNWPQPPMLISNSTQQRSSHNLAEEATHETKDSNPMSISNLLNPLAR